MTRAYTVREIDELRSAVESRFIWGSSLGPLSLTKEAIEHFGDGAMIHLSGRSYREEEKAKVVEEQVRTYMLAGITANDILQEDLAKR